MEEKVLIFGKNTWPHTTAARGAFSKKEKHVEYFDVVSDAARLDEMLKYSGKTRKVPVIVENGKVSIGFNGKAWAV